MTHTSPVRLIARAVVLALVAPLIAGASALAVPSTGDVTRIPPKTGSELQVGVDPQTEEFRQKLADKQKQLDEFMTQLQKLDDELEVATEEYNSAVDRLAKMKQDVTTAQDDLLKAQEAYKVQSTMLGDRASALYKEGTFAAVEMLLDSKSVKDFVSRMKFLNTIGIRDADIAASLDVQRKALEVRVADLENAEAAARSLEFELKARQIEIMSRIDDRQKMLADAQQDLIELLDEEAARRKSEETAILTQILSGASEKGIVARPGSPVETALAYHGVPYLWGGETPSGFDCSGLVLYVFRQHGVELPHYSGSQFQLGLKVVPSAMAPGDAVFFGSPIHHVGIYMGGGYYIHAPRTGDFVKISKLENRNDFAGARRYAWTYRVGEPVNAVNTTSEALQGYNRR